jgi:hypothetical protein
MVSSAEEGDFNGSRAKAERKGNAARRPDEKRENLNLRRRIKKELEDYRGCVRDLESTDRHCLPEYRTERILRQIDIATDWQEFNEKLAEAHEPEPNVMPTAET